MIRVNGVSLNDPALGWVLRPGTVPYSSFEAELAQVTVAGRDGTIPTSTQLRAPIWPLKMNLAPASWEKLQALFQMPTLILTREDNPTVSTTARLVGSNVDRVFPRNEWIDVTFFLEITEAFWRTSVATTTTQDITGLTHTVTTFAGLSAPVQDATLRLRGPFASARVTDSAGSWVMFPFALAAGRFCRFDSASGQAFEYTADQWTNPSSTVDRSGVVDFGGPRGLFEITPYMTSDPATRSGRLMVQTVGYASGSRFEVRGRAAHAL